MKKIILFLFFTLLAFSFDIDDFDKGMYELKEGNFNAAFEIFYAGCESNDDMACEELGLMYINDEVSPKLDTRLEKRDSLKLGILYLMKSCDELGYLNACENILNLKENFTIQDEIIKRAKERYSELFNEFNANENLKEDNATQTRGE
ncbi:sel1 repeat family protein [Campylobacter sp. RM9328]|uniref:sel1 repeat family protein n=1 Tax=Campylobacter sp. RM9328 TaxID=1705720 RepID=UPI0014727621|nr:sel1 repeat family protein [Campylobacter sp. RM9328]